MESRKVVPLLIVVAVLLVVLTDHCTFAMDAETRNKMKLKVLDMFKHAYGSYMFLPRSRGSFIRVGPFIRKNMDHAFPADELMPLSCKGRYRGSEPDRGDVDDCLGNFTLTLIDTLDTLAVLGDIPEFERAVKLVIEHTKFDTDVAVSVFETNIRVLGGLLGGHVFAAFLKRKKLAMDWYKDELLSMARDIGTRLLPAFNTSTGIPYPRINLKHGINAEISQNYKDTCTSCAGTMILEFAALSRFTGDPVFEEKAHKAMDYLWNQRHRQSDLVGTVINIHNGDWIRRESGVGAGIDSYYEYVLKAYILLGDDTYLTRFNKHYEAIMKYVSQGPRYIDVHMHRPQAPSRNFMDALLAFWPGLQVLKGDIQPAIEMHEMLYQVMQKHNFLPEAFTSDFHIHWGHHPLRPEFVESTYFLYKATGDPYYMDVGQKVVENLDKLARVDCGFAAIKDVTKGTHEDSMDSFVLAETFKYLYLLFTEKSELLIDIDDYIFTTEAHLLPLSLSRCNTSTSPAMRLSREMYSHLQALEEESDVKNEHGDSHHNTCPNPQLKFRQTMNYAQDVRAGLKDMVGTAKPHIPVPQQCVNTGSGSRLKAVDFVAGNRAQLQQLQSMGIKLVTMSDGRIQLLHSAKDALSPQLAEEGLLFMQEMIELSKTQPQDTSNEPMGIQFMTEPYTNQVLRAGPAQFGYDLKVRPAVRGMLQVAQPYRVCEPVWNPESINGKIAILERGNCMFIDKARHLQKAGAIGGIVIDHNGDSSAINSPLFAMSGDGKDDVLIPLVFLFHAEGTALLDMWGKAPGLEVQLTAKIENHGTQVSVNSGPEIPSDTPPQGASRPLDQDAGQSQQNSPSDNKPHIERTLTLNPLTPIEEFKMYESPVNLIHKETENLEHIISESVKYTETSEDQLIHIQTLHDGSKQLFFRFDKIPNIDLTEPNLSHVYEIIRFSLYKFTNFADLMKQSEYLTAVVSLIESAYFGKNSIDEEIQELFTELANDLEIVPEDETGQGNYGMEVGSNTEEAELEEGHEEWPTQSEEAVESVNKVVSDSHTQETILGQNEGIQVKIKTKVVRPVEESGDRTAGQVAGQSYATVEDFEESQSSDQERLKKRESVEENKISNVDKELLESMNAELADGLKNVLENTNKNSINKDNGYLGSDTDRQKANVISSTDKKVFHHKVERTVKNLHNFKTQKNSDDSNSRVKTEQTVELGKSRRGSRTPDGDKHRPEDEL